jgi:beta-N-acetylglucosaminidase
VYNLYDCASGFSEALDDVVTYEYADDTYHTKTVAGGHYCEFCFGTRHTHSSTLEKHNFKTEVLSQLDKQRFAVVKTCTDCGYSETEVFYVRSSLRGQGQAFIDASRNAGVNVVYLVCHALNESAWGCSELACGNSWTDPHDGTTGVYYNYFGYAAVDDNPYDGGMRWAKEHGWTSPAAAIAGGAEAISRSWVNNVASPQRTLYEMRWDPAYAARNHEAGWHLYATDDDFCVTVGYLMAWLCDDEGVTPSLNLIVPVYAR